MSGWFEKLCCLRPFLLIFFNEFSLKAFSSLYSKQKVLTISRAMHWNKRENQTSVPGDLKWINILYLQHLHRWINDFGLCRIPFSETIETESNREVGYRVNCFQENFDEKWFVVNSWNLEGKLSDEYKYLLISDEWFTSSSLLVSFISSVDFLCAIN